MCIVMYIKCTSKTIFIPTILRTLVRYITNVPWHVLEMYFKCTLQCTLDESFVIQIFLYLKCTIQTTLNVPSICTSTLRSTSHTCILMYVWCTLVKSFNAHLYSDWKCKLQSVFNVHFSGTLKCAFKCTLLQCTLEIHWMHFLQGTPNVHWRWSLMH
jgi:hypothetical protein